MILDYLSGDVLLAMVVAAYHQDVADFSFALDQDVAPAMQARPDKLWRALSESVRAV